MSEITKSYSTKTTFHDGVVSLEIKQEDEWPTRYTIFLGPREKEKLGRTRIEFSEENFTALRRLIAVLPENRPASTESEVVTEAVSA